MEFGVQVEIMVEAENEDSAHEVVDLLMQQKFGVASADLPAPVRSWAIPEGAATPVEDIERDHQDDEDEESTFPYNALASMGVTAVVIDYAGSNDEGWVNGVTPEGLPEGVALDGELEEELRQIAYDLLEHHHSGWEINEGAAGEITVDVKEKKATIHHGDCVETYEYTDTEVS